MMKCLIIDDEPYAIKLLKLHLKGVNHEIELVGCASTAEEAFSALVKHQPDVIFLDIKLGEKTGFDVLDKFGKIPFQVIFTTAYNQYALKAFDYNAVHYLLKPIELDQVDKALNKLKQTSSELSERNLKETLELLKEQKKTKVAIPSLDSIEFIILTDIEHLAGDGSYTTICLTNGSTITSSRSMAYFEKLLPSYLFCRMHKRYIANVDLIKSLDRGRNPTIYMMSGTILPVSATYKDDLQKKMKAKITF